MSPTPVSNDPGDDGDHSEVRPGDVPAAVLMVAAESSSEDDEGGLNENVEHEIGYQLLTPGMHLQGPAGPDDSDDDDDDDDGSGGGACSGDDDKDARENLEAENAAGLGKEATDSQSHQRHLQLPPLPPNQELRELWKTSRVDSPIAPMAQDQIDAVKSAMAGFNLPASCLPQWASIIPETEWKAQLLLHLESGKAAPEAKPKHSVEDEDSLEADASKVDKLETAATSSGKV